MTPGDRPPPPPVASRRGGNHGGGRPLGHSDVPIAAPAEVIADSVVKLALGADGKEVAEEHHLAMSDVRKIQTLVQLTPAAYFERLADRMEPAVKDTLELFAKKLEDLNDPEKLAKTNIKDIAISLGILRQHLSELRGQSKPQLVHQTNIQINNLSREEAKKFLLNQ